MRGKRKNSMATHRKVLVFNRAFDRFDIHGFNVGIHLEHRLHPRFGRDWLYGIGEHVDLPISAKPPLSSVRLLQEAIFQNVPVDRPYLGLCAHVKTLVLEVPETISNHDGAKSNSRLIVTLTRTNVVHALQLTNSHGSNLRSSATDWNSGAQLVVCESVSRRTQALPCAKSNLSWTFETQFDVLTSSFVSEIWS